MPSQLEEAITAHRRWLLSGDQAALDLMVRAYGPVRTRLVERIESLTAEIAASGVTDGTEALKLDRAQTLLRQVEAEIGRLSSGANALITEGQRQAVGLAGEGARLLVAAQSVDAARDWRRPPSGAAASEVGRIRGGVRLVEWLTGLIRRVGDAIRNAINALVLPIVSATVATAALVKPLDAAGVSLLATTRNAVIDAHRTGLIAAYAANPQVLEEEWEWCSMKDPGVCATCMYLDGQRFPVSQRFMQRHSRCRCFPIPVVQGVTANRELGAAWLQRQSPSLQNRVLGSGAAGDAYRRGEVTLADFTRLVRDERWGDSYQSVGLREALARSEQRSRRAA